MQYSSTCQRKLGPKGGERGGRAGGYKQKDQLSYLAPLLCHHSSPFNSGYDIRTVQELPGHADVSTTMIYTHVLNKPGLTVKNPAEVRLWFVEFAKATHSAWQQKTSMPYDKNWGKKAEN